MYLIYLNNNQNIIDNIDLDKQKWRYYLFNLSKIDLLYCEKLNNKINKKILEINKIKKLIMKLKLPDDIIKYHIIPFI